MISSVAFVSAALPADQEPARAQPRERRMGARRRRSRASTTSRAASAFRKAPCARRSRRSPPTISSFAGRARARSSRRIPRSKSSSFRFLRIRRNDGVDEYPGSRLLDVRRAKASAEVARRLDLKPGDGVILLRRILEFGGAPVVLDDITLPAGLFRGLTEVEVRDLPRVDVRILRDRVRRADAERRGKIACGRRRQDDARGCSA